VKVPNRGRPPDRPLVLRQGASSRRECPGAVRTARRPAVGLRCAARQNSWPDRRPGARPARGAALHEDLPFRARLRVWRCRRGRARPGEV